MKPELSQFLEQLLSEHLDHSTLKVHLNELIPRLQQLLPASHGEPLVEQFIQNLQQWRVLIEQIDTCEAAQVRYAEITNILELQKAEQQEVNAQISTLAPALQDAFVKLQQVYLAWRPEDYSVHDSADPNTKASRVGDYVNKAADIVSKIEKQYSLQQLIALKAHIEQVKGQAKVDQANLPAMMQQYSQIALAAGVSVNDDPQLIPHAPVSEIDRADYDCAQLIIRKAKQFDAQYKPYEKAVTRSNLIAVEIDARTKEKQQLTRTSKAINVSQLPARLQNTVHAIDQCLEQLRNQMAPPIATEATVNLQYTMEIPAPTLTERNSDPQKQPDKPYLAKKHEDIFGKVPDVHYSWYRNLYQELSKIPIDTPRYYAACNLLDDLEFEMEMIRMGYDIIPLFKAYQSMSTDKLLDLKPHILINQDVSSQQDPDFAQQFTELDKQTLTLSGQFKEYLLMVKLTATLRHYAAMPATERTKNPFNPLKDPQYNSLKHHRGFLLGLWESLEEFIRNLFSSETKRQDRQTNYPGCLFSTRSQRMVEETVSMLFQSVPAS